MNLFNYIKGIRKGKEAHRLELDAMYDPFLDDALDGYNQVKGEHFKRISEMQSMVSKRTRTHKLRLLTSVASVAAVLLVISYFALSGRFNAKGYTDSETLYVYVPEDYIMKIQMSDGIINPAVTVDNIDELESKENFDLYVPSEFIERLSIDSGDEPLSSSPKTTIRNLNEIIEISQPLDIYIPEKYL